MASCIYDLAIGDGEIDRSLYNAGQFGGTSGQGETCLKNKVERSLGHARESTSSELHTCTKIHSQNNKTKPTKTHNFK